MKLRVRRLLLLPLFLFVLLDPASSARFSCTGPTTTCRAMAGYVTTNSTTYSSLMARFGIQSLPDLLGANDVPLSTSGSVSVSVNTTVRIPFTCNCTNGIGSSDRTIEYTVKKGDTLYNIANKIFGGLVTVENVTALNGIENPNLILVGQKVWIPLPCSCDAVDDADVVHYAHKVAKGSTVESIASEFGTTEATLLKLNGILDQTNLKADSILDVPLRACNSSIRMESVDHGLLVPNGSYALTAGGCIQCSCNSSTYRLSCVPRDATNRTCLEAKCPGSNLTVGDGLAGTSACQATTCAYAGYNDTDIFTVLTNISTCPAPGPSSPSATGGGSSENAAAAALGWRKLELLVLTTNLIFLFVPMLA